MKPRTSRYFGSHILKVNHHNNVVSIVNNKSIHISIKHIIFCKYSVDLRGKKITITKLKVPVPNHACKYCKSIYWQVSIN